jgi:hypothetical protein
MHRMHRPAAAAAHLQAQPPACTGRSWRGVMAPRKRSSSKKQAVPPEEDVDELLRRYGKKPRSSYKFALALGVLVSGVILGSKGLRGNLRATITGFLMTKSSPAVSEDWSEEYDPKLGVGLDRCNIERVPEAELTVERFERQYAGKRPVVILRDPGRNEAARHMTLKKEMLARFGHKQVKLTTQAGYAFTNITKKKFHKYLAEEMVRGAVAPIRRFSRGFLTGVCLCSVCSCAKILRLTDPSQMERVDPEDKSLWGRKVQFGHDAYGLKKVYQPPLVAQEKRKQSKEWEYHLQTAIANTGSGLPFHMHGSGFSETLHGQKRWFLCPPALSPIFNPRAPTASWLQDVYPQLEDETAELLNRSADVLKLMRDKGALVDDKLVHECTIKENEAIYFPAEWYHATMSLADSVTVTTSWEGQWLGKGKTSRSGIGGAAYAMVEMTESAQRNRWQTVEKRARQYIDERPHSFLGYSWLGMSLFFQFQGNLGDDGGLKEGVDPSTAFDTLFLAANALDECIKLNQLFSPCYLWQYRVMEIMEPSARANDDLEKAEESANKRKVCERAIADLSTMEDDTMYGMDQG